MHKDDTFDERKEPESVKVVPQEVNDSVGKHPILLVLCACGILEVLMVCFLVCVREKEKEEKERKK